MTALAQAEQVNTTGYIEAEFETLVQPQNYTGRDGKPRTAHNVAVFLDGQGGGQVYIDAEVYASVQRQNLKRGERVALGFALSLYQGKFAPRCVSVTRI